MMEKLNGFMVYWCYYKNGGDEMQSAFRFFEQDEMSDALHWMELLRAPSAETQFVTMASQNSNSVGKAGVDTVANGKTPDGVDYDWNKNSRIGATRR